jgi:hypothetical protein
LGQLLFKALSGIGTANVERILKNTKTLNRKKLYFLSDSSAFPILPLIALLLDNRSNLLVPALAK